MFLHDILNEDTRRDVLRKFGAGAAAAAGVTGAKADELDDFVTHYSKQNNMSLAPVEDDKLGIIIQFLNDAKEKLATAATTTVQAANPKAPAHPASQQAKGIAPARHEYIPVTKSPLEPILKKFAEAEHITGAYLMAFLATCAHESAMFTKLVEDSSGKQYEGRKSLGNVKPGDGPRFKGRGFIMLTGRWNYTAASRDIFGDDRLVQNPDLVAKPEIALRTSLWFWKNRVEPDLKRRGQHNVTAATQTVDPGKNKAVHLDRRQDLEKRFQMAQR